MTVESHTNLLFLSWKDIKSGSKGGAEVFTHHVLRRLAATGRYIITHFSPTIKGRPDEEWIDGVRYLRKGNALTVITAARQYFKQHAAEIDYVVDQCNTHRFFTKFWVPSKKRIFFIHQLTREIWFHNAPFPINAIGYWTETPFLRLSKDDYTITVSNSTRQDLLDVGFDPEKTFILPEGLNFEAWPEEDFYEKDPETFLYIGRYVPYKGVTEVIKAFAQVKAQKPNAKLWLVGKLGKKYEQKVILPLIESLGLSLDDIIFWGFVSHEKKFELMSRAKALVFPSIREGWGLTISEAAVVGTPSIVYPAPGTRDAVDEGKAGYLCKEMDVDELAQHMLATIDDPQGYEMMRSAAYHFSKQLDWDKTAAVLEIVLFTINERTRPAHHNDETPFREVKQYVTT